MGIFDGVLGGQSGLAATEKEMYNKHMQHLRAHEDELLRQKHAMQANQYSQQLAQSMAQTKQAVAQSVYQQAMKPFNPNEVEAFKIPLSQLVTLWQAKYGDEWMQSSGEEFWQDALYRLKDANKLEVVKGSWFRIKEDA